MARLISFPRSTRLILAGAFLIGFAAGLSGVAEASPQPTLRGAEATYVVNGLPASPAMSAAMAAAGLVPGHYLVETDATGARLRLYSQAKALSV
ncbi:MAG: hypothetical protein AAF416_01045 [Pseudomonadota bacterium]